LMKAETSKSREWSRELLDRAVEFHGHGGPLMVVGLRMGLLALSLLNAQGWFDLSCRVRLRWRPPDSCVIDGIQTATGCTMGKHNIEVEERDGIAAEFTTDRERLRLRLKPKQLERIRKTLALSDEEAERALIEEIIATKDHCLFARTRAR
jgi:formylmethanofuran dehydrogenase subunit E